MGSAASATPAEEADAIRGSAREALCAAAGRPKADVGDIEEGSGDEAGNQVAVKTVACDDLSSPVQPTRWMQHFRPDGDHSLLKDGPAGSEDAGSIVLNGEVVEVIGSDNADSWQIRLALSGKSGWINPEHLRECLEGTDEHGRLSSEDEAGEESRAITKHELEKDSQRFKEVNDFLMKGSEHELCAERVWFLRGHFLGKTGMVHGHKETLFHGTSRDAAESIVQTGFDDKYSYDGKFGRGLYFSPEALTAYGYGQTMLLCEVALGSEGQRITATTCSSEYSWQSLLQSGKRSVQCHKENFGQEERIVYHCTQCKPVYLVEVGEVPSDDEEEDEEAPAPVIPKKTPLATMLPRWMEHRRTDGIPKSSLRSAPDDDRKLCKGKGSALTGEIVEILDRTGPTNGYLKVRLALTREEGWMKEEYLSACAEGTRNHKRLAGEGWDTTWTELSRRDRRWQEIQNRITATMCSNPRCRCHGVDIRIKRLWFLTGLYLGETGMLTGPKEVLFHGCPDDVVQPIAENGFDDKFCSGGAFGVGLYFSPQACKAFSYAENHLMVCEVALGSEANRITVTQPQRDLCYETVVSQQRKRSVQCHAGHPFNHEERIVYMPTQCKPVYIIETMETSPGGGV